MRAKLSLCALLCFALVTGCRQPGFPADAGNLTAEPTPVTTRLPAAHVYIGVYEHGVPQSYSQIETFAKTIGRQPRLVLYFSGWGEQFQTEFAQQARSHGAIPLVQMNPTNISLTDIAAGIYDTYLTSFADQVRAYRHPVVIGFAHEMNGWWYSWGYGHTSPRVWKEAWRHVVTVFRHQGADNVTWMWTIDRNPRAISMVPRYWPGAAYVDWVGIDGYYFRPTDNFQGIFAPVIKTVRKFTRDPIFLGEVGIGQVAGQAAEIPDLLAGVRRYHLLGLLWYDVAQHGGLYHQVWRLEKDPAAISVFRRGVAQMVAAGR
jgi:glycosyl hydrolase family 26